MKFKIAGVLCLLALLVGIVFVYGQTSASHRSAPESASGRYQLFSATIEKVVPEPQRVVMKIDTQTGQVWMLSLGGGPNSNALYWDPIQENNTKPK